MTQEELNNILKNHKHWLNKDCEDWENMRANGRLSMNQVVDVIPVGYENAITMTELEQITGLDNRAIRKSISDSEELVINLQDGQGYFKPAETETDLVEIWKAITKSRIKELQARVRQAKKWEELRA